MINTLRSCFFLLLQFMLLDSQLQAQLLLVNNSSPYNDPLYLVEQVLLDTGVTVSNVTFNGSPGIPTGANANMLGYFNGSGSNIGFAAGVLLNTGSIFDAPGPNDSPSDGFDNGTLGDADLNAIVSPFTTFNAAVLEFDFETVNDTVSFRYVFASEEYNEFVCSNFNDVFAFLISGPGIPGIQNIALIPSTTTPVAINTVNNGTIGSVGAPNGCGGPGDPGLNNSAYFIDNEALGGQSVQYDGFTTVLTAQKTLIPCETYHIKLAVADVSDGIYDSGVFLEVSSFGSPIGVPYALNVDSVVNSNCTNPNNGSIYTSVTGGTSPYSFIWSNGDTTSNITGLSPGIYYITVTDANGCAFTDSVIVNLPAITLAINSLDASCGSANGSALVAASGGTSPYSYLWNDPANQTTDTASGLATGIYTVVVTDSNGCTQTGTIGVNNAGGPTVTVDSISDAMCNADSNGFVSVSVTGGTAPYTYLWNDSMAQTTPIATGLPSGTYSILVTDSSNCSGTAFVNINEPPFILTPVNDTICSNDSIFLQGNYQSTAGIYYDTLASVNGCDSVIATTLTINPTYLFNTSDETICNGDSILIFGVYQKTTGIYYDNLSTLNGCDSIISTALTVNPLPAVTFTGLDTAYCTTDAPVTLAPTPAGGSFSGTGISGNQFDPAVAGTGTHTITYSYTDSNNCTGSASQNVNVNICSGVEDIEFINHFKIFPNPNTGELTIEFNITMIENLELKITNTLGQEIFKEKLNQFKGNFIKRLNLQKYPAGIYTFQLVSDRGVMTKQVNIE